MQASDLAARSRWIFDMDGTLTVAVHDFDAIRRELDLPAGRPILESLAALPVHEAAPKRERLQAIEADLIARTQPAEGARALLEALTARGATLGILTRNSRVNALATLESAALLQFFDERDVLGRDDAVPKPDPAGIVRLLTGWSATPTEGVMVGDYLFDLEAGRAAGVMTVHVDVEGKFPYADHADVQITTLAALPRELDAQRG